jgi:protein Mpv17
VVVEATYQAAKKAGVPRNVRHWLVYPTAMAVVCGTLWGLGDYISQRMLSHTTDGELEEKKATGSPRGLMAGIDRPRLYSTTAYGGIVAGVGASYWYRWLDAYVGSKVLTGHTSARFIAAKLALEIGIWHPITLTIFWISVGAAQGQTVAESLADLRAKFVKTLAAEFALWTPLDIVNFRYTPVHLQPVFVAFGSIIEAVFLSYFRGEH